MKNPIIVLFLTCLITSCTNNNDHLQNKIAEIDARLSVIENKQDQSDTQKFIADTDAEYQKLIADPASNIIRNLSDFDQLISQNLPIFSDLDPATIQGFRNDVVFRDNQLITANFEIIERKLSLKSNTEFWNKFGLSRKFVKCHKKYRCESPNNCKWSPSFICMSGC